MSTLWRTLRTIIYKLALSGIVLLSSVLVARYLTVSDRGIYGETTTVLLLGSSYLSGYANFFNFGLNRLKFDRQTLFGVLLRQYALIGAGIVVLLVISIAFTPFHWFFLYAAFILATLPFVLLFSFSTKLVNALNEIDLLNRLNMIQNTTFLIFGLILFVIHKLQPAVLSPLLLTLTFAAWLVSNGLAAMIAIWITLRVGKVRLKVAKDRVIAVRMKEYGHRISLQNFLAQLNYRGDLFFVGILAGTTAAGLYSIAVTASETLWQVSSSIALIVYARVAREERGNSIALTERTFRYIFWILIVLGLMLLAVSPLIPVVFTARYARSVPAFQVLLIGTAAFGTTGLLTQFFTDQLGKVKYPIYMQMASIATNTLISLLFIPRIGIMGGALASSAAYVVALVMSIAYFRFHTERPLRSLFLFTAEDMALFRNLLARSRLHKSRE